MNFREIYRQRPRCGFGAIVVVMLGGVSLGTAQVPRDYAMREAEARVKADPEDFIAWNRLGDLYLGRYRDVGQGIWLDRAASAAEASLKAVEADLNPIGLGLRARVDLAHHRFADARDRSRQWQELQPAMESPLAIQIDALLELGDLSNAEKEIEELREIDEASLTMWCRLARFTFLKGDNAKARGYWDAGINAASQSDAAPGTIAWCWVQKGELAFRAGQWDEAEKAYQTALSTFPDWWSAREHLAELRGAQGKDAEAVELFEKVAKAAQRPEVWQSLGDLHVFYKRPDAAKAAFERALKGYQESIGHGEILYVHHLAGFYSDSQEDAAEAVKWARKDLEERQTPFTWDALAWALYRHNEIPEALEMSKKVVASGIADSHVIYHAAMIHISAGEVPEGQRLLKRCAEINPHFNAFHVHR